MNNINSNNPAPAMPVKLDAAAGQAVNQQPAGAVSRNSASPQPAATPALLLALASFTATGLTELGKTLAGRTALVDSLAPEIQELVKNILKQTQSAATALPAGAAALLRSPRTAADKLLALAAALEQMAAGETGTAPAGTPAGKAQAALTEFTRTWRQLAPGELKAAARAVRELATTVLPQPEQAPAGQAAAPAAAAQPGSPAAKAGAGAAVPAPPPGESPEPETPAKTPARPERQDNTAAPGKPAVIPLPGQARQGKDMAPMPLRPGPEGAGAQADAADLAKTELSRPELAKNLRPEIREFIQTLLRQAPPAQPGKPGQQALPNPPARPDLQTRPGLADLPAPLAAFIKSARPLAEKLILFAAALEQAAESSGPAERSAAAKAVPNTPANPAEAAAAWPGKNPQELKSAANIIRNLAETMPKPGGVVAERQEQQSLLTFTTSLYFGDGQTAYPAHIHIYQQEQQDKNNPAQTEIETWLRLSLETENIGVVETSFRLYDGHTVDVKVRFADPAAADGFAAVAGEVKAKLGELPLTLGEFLVK